MKQLIAYVCEHASDEASGPRLDTSEVAGQAPNQPAAPGVTRIEAVLSDEQLAHVLADLTAAASPLDSAVLIREFVQQQILLAGDNATDLIRRIVDRVQEELIAQVLEQCSGVQVRAAARLGIDRNSLRKKLCAQKAIAGSATQTPV